MITSRLRGFLALTLLGATLFASACRLNPRELRTIEAWLHCDECTDGERSAVKAIGGRAVKTLEKLLRQGPSPARRDLMRAQFAASYTPTPAVTLTRDEYAAQLLENFVANYQKRSAVSLADIGGRRARSALQRALDDTVSLNYRADVVRVIRIARATVNAEPFAGRARSASVAFGDVVVLEAAPGPSFTGDEIAAIDESVFPASELLLPIQPESLRFFAVGDPGAHVVTISNVGTTSNTEHAVITIRSLIDRNDQGMLSCTTIGCRIDSAQVIPLGALPYVTFFSLWRRPVNPDTIDFFRIQSPSSITVTARLDWRAGSTSVAPGDVDLVVRPCTPGPLPPPPLVPLIPPNPASASIPIAAGSCAVVLVRLRPGLTHPVFGRLRFEP
jgi:hypothetical protein